MTQDVTAVQTQIAVTATVRTLNDVVLDTRGDRSDRDILRRSQDNMGLACSSPQRVYLDCLRACNRAVWIYLYGNSVRRGLR